MKRPEILAPAGNRESLVAAISAGCDAVYLGGTMFGARSFAGNFSNDELKDIVEYAHLRGVKVYITTNTIVYEREVEKFISYIDFLVSINVDAVIVQDIGMMDLIRKTYPDLEVHASTQMHIHNLDGVKLLEKLGVKRCVLARETSINNIEKIKKESKMDLEIFVHGALCVSYSGQCLMSYSIGGRSGNRGTCAQPCRQMYKTKNDQGYLISPKDLCTLNDIGQLIDIGVESLKIEGRMKRPEYVYMIVSLYKKAVDNYLAFGETKITDKDINGAKKLFNREFTKGFLFHETSIINKKRPNHIGILAGKVIKCSDNQVTIELIETLSKGDGIRFVNEKDSGMTIVNIEGDDKIAKIDVKENIKVGTPVYKTTDANQLKEIESLIKVERKVRINCFFEAKLNEKMILKYSDGINEVVLEGPKVDQALKHSTTKKDVEKQISRLGDSVYELNKSEIIIDDNIFVPVSVLNQLRRDAVEQLNVIRLEREKIKKSEYSIELPNFPRVKSKNAFIKEDIKLDHKYDTVYMEENVFNKSDIKNKKLRLPRVFEGRYSKLDDVMVSELGALNKTSNVDSDYSFNVVNSYSVALLHSLGVKKITLSYELSLPKIEAIINSYKKRYNSHPNLEVVTRGRMPLMIMKTKLDDNLEDRFRNKYKVTTSGDFTEIIDYQEINFDEDELFNIGVNNIRHDYY